MATTSKKTYQFPRNQCIACNDIIHEQNHALLLFWSSGEAEKIHLKFENFTGITLNAEDPYPKICLPCKFKVESAVGFKNLCVKLREAQEENLSHVKSGRRCEAESSSPSLKRMLSAASDDSESNYCCNPVACKLVPRYRKFFLILRWRRNLWKAVGLQVKNHTYWAMLALKIRRWVRDCVFIYFINQKKQGKSWLM